MTKSNRIQSLQIFRGFAAVYVLLFHALFNAKEIFGDETFLKIFKNGFRGVDFFFCLSGFIIFYTNHQNFGNPQKAKEFVLKRVLRIFPIYWIYVGAIILIYTIIPQLQTQRITEILSTPMKIVKTFILFPQQYTNYLITYAWSLSYELLFYFIFTFLIINRKKTGSIVLLIGYLLIVVLRHFNIIEFNNFYIIDFVFNSYILQFTLGCFAAFIVVNYKNWVLKNYKYIIVAGILLFLITNVNEYYQFYSMDYIFIYSTLYTLIIVGASGINSFENIVVRQLNYIGDASYTIYLTHGVIMSFVCKCIFRLNLQRTLGVPVTMLIVILLTIAIASTLYSMIEKPLMRYLYKLYNQNIKGTTSVKQY